MCSNIHLLRRAKNHAGCNYLIVTNDYIESGKLRERGVIRERGDNETWQETYYEISDEDLRLILQNVCKG